MKGKPVIARLLRWLVRLLFSGLAIWLVIRVIDFQVFVINLAKIRWQTLVFATIIYFVSYILRAFSWYILLRRKVPYRDAFFTMGVGYLLNNILPFRMGEIGRALMLDDSGRTSPLEVFSSVVVERIFDVFLAAIFILSVLPRIISGGFDQRIIFVVFLLAIIGLIALYLLAKFRAQVTDWLKARGEKSKFIKVWFEPKVAHVLEGFVVLTDTKAFLLAFSSLALSWGLAFGKNYLIFNDLFPQPPFWWMLFILSAGAFGAALPSAPAGLGVYEGVVVASFALLGVDTEIAFTHAIVTHAMTFIYANLIGLIGLRLRGKALISFVQHVLKRSSTGQAAE